MKVEPLSGWNCLRFEQSKQKLSNPLEQLLALYFSGVQREFETKNEFKNLMSLTGRVGLHHVTEMLGENVITWKAWPDYSGRKYSALINL